MHDFVYIYHTHVFLMSRCEIKRITEKYPLGQLQLRNSHVQHDDQQIGFEPEDYILAISAGDIFSIHALIKRGGNIQAKRLM